MGRWVRAKSSALWHYAEPTASPIYCVTLCGYLIRVEESQSANAYPPREDQWCRACLHKVSAQEAEARKAKPLISP